MDHRSMVDNERSVLRWGGLAGVAGAVLLLTTFGIVGAFVGLEAADSEGYVARFPDIRAARIVENGLYLGAMALWAIHVAALYETLRGPRQASALFGRVLAMFGLVVLAVGALPHIATTPISDLYRAAASSPGTQATLAMSWQATQGMFEALLVTGMLVLPLGLVALGWAMRSTPAFGPWAGGLAIACGVVAFASGLVNLVEVSPSLAIGVFALIVCTLVVGWRMYRVSREPSRALEPVAAMQGAA